MVAGHTHTHFFIHSAAGLIRIYKEKKFLVHASFPRVAAKGGERCERTLPGDVGMLSIS